MFVSDMFSALVGFLLATVSHFSLWISVLVYVFFVVEEADLGVALLSAAAGGVDYSL